MGKVTTISDKVLHVKKAAQSREHTCHWPNCPKQVPPAMWGCRRHWYTLPKQLRLKIWMAYRIRQEETLTPSKLYIKIATEVQAWIAEYQDKECREKIGRVK